MTSAGELRGSEVYLFVDGQKERKISFVPPRHGGCSVQALTAEIAQIECRTAG